MRDWTAEELDRIGAADELQIAALRPDGSLRPSTYRTKYARYASTYVDPMVSLTATAATLRLIPR